MGVAGSVRARVLSCANSRKLTVMANLFGVSSASSNGTIQARNQEAPGWGFKHLERCC